MFIAYIGIALVMAGGGGTPGQVPPTSLLPYNNIPLMTGQLTEYPAEVVAGSIFHIKATSWDRDTFRINIPLSYPTYPSYTHAMQPTLESGAINNSGNGCTGQNAEGSKFWDWSIVARTVPDGYDYILCHDKFNLTDAGWSCTPDLADPTQPSGSPGYWELVIKVKRS
jgi:hypothetical protein